MTRHTEKHKTPIPTAHSREIKAAMVRAGLTQTAAARQLGVTFEHLNRVINGRRPSRRLARQLSDLIGQPV